MDNISTLTGVSLESLSDIFSNSQDSTTIQDDGFSDILQSAINMVNETNDLQNQAEEAEIEFALGDSTNTHDLQIAQQKASIALQYTVAVRDKLLEAYKDIINIQI
jgi:flagellar hook-basal body complex protein FliE